MELVHKNQVNVPTHNRANHFGLQDASRVSTPRSNLHLAHAHKEFTDHTLAQLKELEGGRIARHVANAYRYRQRVAALKTLDATSNVKLCPVERAEINTPRIRDHLPFVIDDTRLH